MAETSVSLSEAALARLSELARWSNTSLGDALDQAIKDQYDRRFWEATDAGYAALRADPSEAGEEVAIESPTGSMVRLTGRSPLRPGADGALLVGDTEVSLEEVLLCHKAGSSPEDIVACYEALRLADVYAAIAYYLDHREEVDAYLARREQAEAAVRRRVEETHALSNEELLALARRHPAPQEWYESSETP